MENKKTPNILLEIPPGFVQEKRKYPNYLQVSVESGFLERKRFESRVDAWEEPESGKSNDFMGNGSSSDRRKAE